MEERQFNPEKPLNIFIPEWIGSIDDLAQKYSVVPDRLKLVLYQFFVAYNKSKRLEKQNKKHRLKDYFPVYSELLKKAGTKKYTCYVEILLKEGIIQRYGIGTNGKCYVVGGHSQLYKWVIPDGMNGKMKARRETVTDVRTLKAAYNLRRKSQHIRFKGTQALERRGTFEDVKGFVLEAYMVDNDLSSSINALDWFTVDDFGHRFHHKFINIPKSYRPYLRFRGHEHSKLVEIDLKNSQVYFLSICAMPGIIEMAAPQFKRLAQFAEAKSRSGDWQYFLKLCAEGGFYELFMAPTTNEEDFKKERDKIKKQMYRSVLFAKKKVSKSDKLLEKRFSIAFPSVYEFILAIRTNGLVDLPDLGNIICYYDDSSKTLKEDGFRLMPCLLQRIESYIVFELIGKRLIREKLPFIPIHDCFMVLPEHEAKVKEIIKGAFEFLGVRPPSVEKAKRPVF